MSALSGLHSPKISKRHYYLSIGVPKLQLGKLVFELRDICVLGYVMVHDMVVTLVVLCSELSLLRFWLRSGQKGHSLPVLECILLQQVTGTVSWRVTAPVLNDR